ncbi:MAG: glycosyltransferase family 2 protein [Spirochaetales bacterium]|nr:glycosyltransferase family 2 protein [Spirochaetales bacterium]
MYKNKKIGVIIPALNEEKSLPLVIRDIPDYVDTIIIIDNGSTDSTFTVITNQAHRDHRIIPCREERTGYGNACLKGMMSLSNEDIVVFLDADYCEYPEKMYLLLDPIVEKKFDLVLANRHHKAAGKGSFTLPQKWGTKLIIGCMRLLWNFRYQDLGPFRAIRLDKLITLGMKDKNYGWTMEMQIRGLKHRLKIIEVDLPYRARQAGKSKVSGTLKGVVLAGIKMIFRLFYYKIERLFDPG